MCNVVKKWLIDCFSILNIHVNLLNSVLMYGTVNV